VPRPFARLKWALNRVIAIVADDLYSTDETLADELGLDYGELRLVVSVLYRQRLIDRADGYLVLPVRQLAAAESGEVPPWEVAG
jgi:hypothetical protein